jgi:hypothetical protein
MSAPLTKIAALARLGAIDRAWQLFEEGYASRPDDPAALAVKGRLLKDQAMRVQGVEQRTLLARAAQAYADADAIAPAPYLLINVAALATLSGDPVRGAVIAGDVLLRLEQEVAETPYYIAATEAEAFILRGDRKSAEDALDRAWATLPDGWEERAGTLRQLARILKSTGQDEAWLDRFRAPASLHYAGHLGIGHPAGELSSAIEEVIADRRIGFAFGSLAAGADLLIAKAVLTAGAELHVILPCSPETFARQSVTPYGPAWMKLYEACLAQSTSSRVIGPAGGRLDLVRTALAAEVAIGASLRNAVRLAAEAVQLLIVDDSPGPFGGGAATARDARVWPAWRRAEQIILRWPRDVPAPATARNAVPASDRSLMAVVLIAPGTDVADDDALDDWIDRVREQLGSGGSALSLPPHVNPHGNALLLGFADVADAAHFAGAASNWAASKRATIVACAYGLVRDVNGTLAGSAVATAEAVLKFSEAGAVTVDDLFADALALRTEDASFVALGDYQHPSGQALSLFTLIDRQL